MRAHPPALQLRNLQSLAEIGVDKNTTVVFPAPLMSTIEEIGSFPARENASAAVVRTGGTSSRREIISSHLEPDLVRVTRLMSVQETRPH